MNLTESAEEEADISSDIPVEKPIEDILNKLETDKIINQLDRSLFYSAISDTKRVNKVTKALRELEVNPKKYLLRKFRSLIREDQDDTLVKGGSLSLHSSRRKQQNEPSTNTNVDSVDESLNKILIQPDRIAELSTKQRCESMDTGNRQTLRLSTKIRTASGDNALSTTSARSSEESPTPKPFQFFENQNEVGIQSICLKIRARLSEFLMEYRIEKMGLRKFGILIGQGLMNPLTRKHMRSYFVAKEDLENKYGFVILGSILSPAHGMSVSEALTSEADILPPLHRLTIAQLMVLDSKWLTVDPWEISRPSPVDYLSYLKHISRTFQAQFENYDIKLIYLCKPGFVANISPELLSQHVPNCQIGVVSHPSEMKALQSSADASSLNSLLYIFEDYEALDISSNKFTSEYVREQIKAWNPEYLRGNIGEGIVNYLDVNKIAVKLRGQLPWTDEDLSLPTMSALSPLTLSPSLGSSKSRKVLNINDTNDVTMQGKQRLLPTIGSKVFSASKLFTNSSRETIRESNNVTDATTKQISMPNLQANIDIGIEKKDQMDSKYLQVSSSTSSDLATKAVSGDLNSDVTNATTSLKSKENSQINEISTSGSSLELSRNSTSSNGSPQKMGLMLPRASYATLSIPANISAGITIKVEKSSPKLENVSPNADSSSTEAVGYVPSWSGSSPRRKSRSGTL